MEKETNGEASEERRAKCAERAKRCASSAGAKCCRNFVRLLSSAMEEGKKRPCCHRPRGWCWARCGEVVVAVLMVLMAICRSGQCYNMDTVTAMVHQGQPGSMFGFSVAQHIDQSTNWLLVGAPKAQTSQPGIQQGGAVYRCRTDRADSCKEIPFDPLGNNIRWNSTAYVEMEDKSHQWFGATVRSSGENGVIVACAPRYVYFSANLDKREPVGSCYVHVTTTNNYDAFSPCKNGQWGYHRQGSCQAGYSASFSQGGKKLLVGAVGSWYWQGQLFNFNSGDNQEYTSTNEGPAEDDDTYMGYSSAVGDFDGDYVDDYVVGIPKGASHLGKVALFKQDLKNINNITGEQIGAYFGAALAVADLNADKRDDIIVGAPFYSDFSGTDYETGRVYIFYQTSNHEFRSQKQDILDGKRSKSRFGLALSRLGDINYDNYDDLAVGAPFDGEDGRGAVYIYHGSSKGVITQVSQVIYAMDVDTGLSTFGSSLSGGWDQDDNLYPDLIVGAYNSDQAVFLRARPVVKIYAGLQIDPKDINLEQKSCSLMDNTRVSCVKIYSCLEYDGTGVPSELYFDASWELDVLQRNMTVDEQRAFFANNPLSFRENNTFKLVYREVMCINSYAYIKNDLVDKLTPIAIDFDFKLNDKHQSSRQKRHLEPVLDQYTPTSVRTEANIQKECGKDNKCIPDLVLIAFRITAAHIIGSDTDLEIMVIVENRKENAYNTKLFVQMPSHVRFRNRVAVTSVEPVKCKARNDTVVCDLGNPLPAGETSSFTLRVSAQKTNESTDALKFYLKVTSTNPETDEDKGDNVAEVEIPVTASADITLYGHPEPEQVILNTTRAIKPGIDDSYLVEHRYQLQNLGHSDTEEIRLQILWPSHDRHGLPILELSGKLQMNGTGRCEVLLITPENAKKYGYARPGRGNIHIVLPSDQDEFENEQRGDSVVLACTKRRCTVIQCIVGYLEADGNFILSVKARLNVTSFFRRREEAKVYHIRSSASAKIVSLPYNLTSINVSRFAIARESIITTVITDRLKPGPKKVEIWIIIVAVTVGILHLLVLILLLWCCGFFKRRKPSYDGYMVAGVTSANIDNKIYE